MDEETKSDAEKDTSSKSSPNPKKGLGFEHNSIEELGSLIEKFISKNDHEKQFVEELENAIQNIEESKEKCLDHYLSLLNAVNNLYSEITANPANGFYQAHKNRIMKKKRDPDFLS